MAWDVREGDALALLQQLPDGQVDAVIADPPYSSGGTTSSDRQSQTPTQKYVSSDARPAGPDFSGDNRDQRSFGYWCTLWLSECLRASKPGAVAAVFCDWRQLPTMSDAVQAAGWVWRGIVVYAKSLGRSRPSKARFRNQAEYLVWATNGPRPRLEEVGCLPGVIQGDPPRKDRVHITQKPVDLLEKLVQIAPPGGLILDPFAGSGTTGVAAIRQNRRFLGIEMSPEYAEIARQRIATAEPRTGA